MSRLWPAKPLQRTMPLYPFAVRRGNGYNGPPSRCRSDTDHTPQNDDGCLHRSRAKAP